jgi:hypothetical protein
MLTGDVISVRDRLQFGLPKGICIGRMPAARNRSPSILGCVKHPMERLMQPMTNPPSITLTIYTAPGEKPSQPTFSAQAATRAGTADPGQSDDEVIECK